MNNNIGIYKITNLVNNKVYVGQSKNLKKRFQNHKATYNSSDESWNTNDLYKEMRKYGIDNFTFDILEYCESDILDYLEVQYIKRYKANDINFGYNRTNIINNKSVYSKLLEEDLNEIIRLLRETTLSAQAIAEKFNVTQATINYIDKGEIYFNNQITYPIRNIEDLKNKRKEEYIAKLKSGEIVNKLMKLLKCKNCGKELLTSNKGFCSFECSRIHRRLVDRPSKEELLELILTTPFTTIAKQFKVSDNSIRKWCKFYNIPANQKDIKAYKQSLNNA